MKEREIKLSLQDREVLASLARINSMLSQTQSKADSTGKSIGSAFDPKKFGQGMQKGLDSLSSGFKGLGLTIGAVAGSVALSLRGMAHGLDDISKGFKDVLYDMQNGSTKAGDAISDLTNGLIDGRNSG